VPFDSGQLRFDHAVAHHELITAVAVELEHVETREPAEVFLRKELLGMLSEHESIDMLFIFRLLVTVHDIGDLRGMRSIAGDTLRNIVFHDSPNEFNGSIRSDDTKDQEHVERVHPNRIRHDAWIGVDTDDVGTFTSELDALNDRVTIFIELIH